jgi:hypothetical protein
MISGVGGEGHVQRAMSWHPRGKWGAGEVLEHPYLSYRTIKGFERVMTRGKPHASPASMAHRIRSCRSRKVRNEIGAQILAMDAIMEHCGALFGAGAGAPSSDSRRADCITVEKASSGA